MLKRRYSRLFVGRESSPAMRGLKGANVRQGWNRKKKKKKESPGGGIANGEKSTKKERGLKTKPLSKD